MRTQENWKQGCCSNDKLKSVLNQGLRDMQGQLSFINKEIQYSLLKIFRLHKRLFIHLEIPVNGFLNHLPGLLKSFLPTSVHDVVVVV